MNQHIMMSRFSSSAPTPNWYASPPSSSFKFINEDENTTNCTSNFTSVEGNYQAVPVCYAVADSNGFFSEAPSNSSNGTNASTIGKSTTTPPSLVDAPDELQLDKSSFSSKFVRLFSGLLGLRSQKNKVMSVVAKVLRTSTFVFSWLVLHVMMIPLRSWNSQKALFAHIVILNYYQIFVNIVALFLTVCKWVLQFSLFVLQSVLHLWVFHPPSSCSKTCHPVHFQSIPRTKRLHSRSLQSTAYRAS